MIAAESCHRSSTVAEGNPVIRIHDGHLIDNTKYTNRHKMTPAKMKSRLNREWITKHVHERD